jgi:hypothetical protein
VPDKPHPVVVAARAAESAAVLWPLVLWPLMIAAIALAALVLVISTTGFAGFDNLLRNGGTFEPYFTT